MPAVAGVAVALAAIAVGVAPALAAQRFAAPAPVGAMNCRSPANACSIGTAVGGASSGDEVIVEPGSYGMPGTPLTSLIRSSESNLNIHGVDTTPGPPSAQIFTNAIYGVELFGPGSKISDLEIEDSGSSLGASLLLQNVTGERLIVRAGEHEGRACDLQFSATLSDSLCQQGGSGAALAVNGVLSGPNYVTVQNVTAIGGGLGIEAVSAAGRPTAVNVINTIARGGAADISASQFTELVSVSTSHSNYATTETLGGGTVSDDGTSQTVGVQTAAQLFVEPAGGNFHEAPGAQTIDAGADNLFDGFADLEGNPRRIGAHTDIGAYEFTTPKLTGLSETNKTFAPAKASTPLTGQTSSARKRGTTFSFRLDQAAPVMVWFQRQSPGRRVLGHECAPNSKRLRHKQKCTVYTTMAMLRRTGHAGSNQLPFTGRIRGRALRPGRYRGLFSAKNGAGASMPRAIRFTVVAR